jgi:hypothetical protein
MTDNKKQDLEKWIMRGVCGVTVLMAGYIGKDLAESVKELKKEINVSNVQMAEVRRELDIVKPADILRAVNELEKRRLTRAEVQLIVEQNAPWTRDKALMEERIRVVQQNIALILEKLRAGTLRDTKDNDLLMELQKRVEELETILDKG